MKLGRYPLFFKSQKENETTNNCVLNHLLSFHFSACVTISMASSFGGSKEPQTTRFYLDIAFKNLGPPQFFSL